jgi:hypothetical protein
MDNFDEQLKEWEDGDEQLFPPQNEGNGEIMRVNIMTKSN